MLEQKYIRHSILAENFIKLKEYQKAIAQYQLALRYRPTEIMLYINLGELLFLSGQTKLALDILYRGSLISLKAGKLTKAQTILDLMTQIDQQHRLTSLVSNDVRTLSQINSNTK